LADAGLLAVADLLNVLAGQRVVIADMRRDFARLLDGERVRSRRVAEERRARRAALTRAT
jgi:hypothetical protein